MRKQTAKLLGVALCAAMFIVSCARNNDNITIVSREEGSGTRSAFTELFGVLDDQRRDITTSNAEITNNTAVMINSVLSNKLAIGYISMGSMNDDVKALKINGVAATAENVTIGTYPISRPFLIGTRGENSDLAQDFINFMLSEEGQRIVASRGYIGIEHTGSFTASSIGGRVVVAGSSSVAPLMERLREAYLALNPNATVEIQQNDSSTGVRALQSGICDIAMSSRDLRAAEIEAGVIPTVIARDGIAVIVNKNNEFDGLSKEQVRAVYLGEVSNWSELK